MQMASIDIPETRRQERYEMRKEKEDMVFRKCDEEKIASNIPNADVVEFLAQVIFEHDLVLWS